MSKILDNFKILFSILYFITTGVFAQESLFKITVDKKVGYISKVGDIIIQPKFDSGSDFQKGTAIVLLGTKYGIVDYRGVYLTKPVFEMIGEFKNDAAIAVLNGKRVVIDRKGRVLYSGKLVSCEGYFEGNLIICTEYTNPTGYKFGVYNVTDKRFIVPASYDYISLFTKGYAIGIAVQLVGKELKYSSYLINISGKVTKLENRFKDIEDLGGVLVANKDNPVIIDYKGNIIGSFKEFESGFDEKYHDGYIKGTFGKTESDRKNAFADARGRIVYKWVKTYNQGITDFYNGLAWQYDSVSCYLVNKKFEKVTHTIFTNFTNFYDNKALASTAAGWNIIDKKGNILVTLPFEIVDGANGIKSNCFLFKERDKDSLWGVANGYGKVLLKPSITAYDKNGFVNGLLYCTINNKSCYINNIGKNIWNESTTNLHRSNIYNVKYAWHARYKFYESDAGNGNKTSSSPYAKPINVGIDFPSGKISLILDTKKKTETLGILGCTLFIANTGNVPVYFLGPDRNIFMQAKDEYGNWKAIENVDHPIDRAYFVRLKPNEYWEIGVPMYTGVFETEIRMVMRISVGNIDDFKFESLYSNPVKGSINPTQFYNENGDEPYDWISQIKKNN